MKWKIERYTKRESSDKRPRYDETKNRRPLACPMKKIFAQNKKISSEKEKKVIPLQQKIFNDGIRR